MRTARATPVDPPRTLPAILLGAAGAIIVAVGSLSVGWLGPHSNVLQWSLLEWFREDNARRATWSVLVIVGGFLLVAGWLLLGLHLRVWRRDVDPLQARPPLLLAAVAWGLPLLVCVPMYSRDLFSYVAQGHLLLDGGNPYQEGVERLPDWYGIGVDPMWSDVKTPYGPVILALGAGLVKLSGDSVVVAVAMFRILAVLGLLATAWFAHRIIRHRGGNSTPVWWLILASPLSLMVFVASGHHDSLMLALILAGIHLAQTRRPWPAILLIALAVGIKPIAVLALPVVGLFMAGPERSRALLWRWWIGSGALTVAVLGGIGAIMGLGFGWISALGTPGAVSHWYAPGNWFIQLPALVSDLVVGDRTPGLEGGRLALTAAGAAIVLWVYLTSRPLDPLVRVAVAFGAMVLFSPFVHPWYASWVIVLVVVAARPGVEVIRRRNLVLAALTTFFSWVAFVDTTDGPAEVDGSSWPVALRVTTNVLTAIGLAALIWYGRVVARRDADAPPVRVGPRA